MWSSLMWIWLLCLCLFSEQQLRADLNIPAHQDCMHTELSLSVACFEHFMTLNWANAFLLNARARFKNLPLHAYLRFFFGKKHFAYRCTVYRNKHNLRKVILTIILASAKAWQWSIPSLVSKCPTWTWKTDKMCKCKFFQAWATEILM